MNEKDLINKVDMSVLMVRPLTDWYPLLASECQVFTYGEVYVAKRFDEINYLFCSQDEAKEILEDNLYALLRFKYFTMPTEESDERVNKIVKGFMANIKSRLKKITINERRENVGDEITNKKFIPNYCVAFENGVYNFKDNKWFFKYDKIELKGLNNYIYLYDENYMITWYMNFNFQPIFGKLDEMSIEEMINMMKEITKTEKNYCFELMYNMSHNRLHNFDLDKFKHLCEILGYTILQSFSQNFILLIGSGQNGKNSLFDGCFTNRVLPRPASNDLDTIENDRFITGSLENKAHNIFLETDAKTMTKSKMLKALTGSMYQTIEQKGVNRYSSIINCKFVFAGNDRDAIKFSDNTMGFRRRVNLFEIFYQWDKKGRYLEQGDYYDTKFSDSLIELKENISNSIMYVYFAMYGIMSATKNFTENFRFTHNEWTIQYEDIDMELKERVNNVSINKLYDFIVDNTDRLKTDFYDEDKNLIKNSTILNELGCFTIQDFLNFIEDESMRQSFFSDHDFYLNIRFLQLLIGNFVSPTTFTQQLKKTFKINNLEYLYANKPYVKCRFISNKLTVID